MSRSIGDWDGPGTGFTISDAVAYIDTLTLFCRRRLPKGDLRSLRNQYGRHLIVEEHEVPAGSPQQGSLAPLSKRWLITIHQPGDKTLLYLSSIQQGIFVVHAVHIAVDFLCPDHKQVDLATSFLTRAVVQKWRRRNERSHLEINTRYWKANRKAGRNIALYGDRQSKTGMGDCSHFEMRFTSAAACKRASLSNLHTLVGGINVMTLLARQAKIAPIDPQRLNRRLDAIARNTTRRSAGSNTVSKNKLRAQRLMARGLQDEGIPLDENSITKARSQSLWDHQRQLRACLKEVQWKDFTPPPKWHSW